MTLRRKASLLQSTCPSAIFFFFFFFFFLQEVTILTYFVHSHASRFCLCCGFTAQSTQRGHVEHGQFT